MPKNDRERTRKARALMQQRPELNYTRALAEVDAAHAPRERDVDPVLLARIPMRMASSSRNSVGASCPPMQPRPRGRVRRRLAVLDLSRAERILQALSGSNWKQNALGDFVAVLAATDPGRAENIALSCDDPSHVLFRMAMRIASSNPDHAERLVQSIADEWKAAVLIRIAEAQIQ
jgi:hypothetical protein